MPCTKFGTVYMLSCDNMALEYILAMPSNIKTGMINKKASRDLALTSFIDCFHKIWAKSDERPRGRNILYVFRLFSVWWKNSVGGMEGPYAFDTGVSLDCILQKNLR